MYTKKFLFGGSEATKEIAKKTRKRPVQRWIERTKKFGDGTQTAITKRTWSTLIKQFGSKDSQMLFASLSFGLWLNSESESPVPVLNKALLQHTALWQFENTQKKRLKG